MLVRKGLRQVYTNNHLEKEAELSIDKISEHIRGQVLHMPHLLYSRACCSVWKYDWIWFNGSRR